jgi:hypothetical protein
MLVLRHMGMCMHISACSLANPAAMRMCHIVTSVAPCSPPYFSALSHKRCNFWKKVIEHEICVLIFCTTFVQNRTDIKIKNSNCNTHSKQKNIKHDIPYSSQLCTLLVHMHINNLPQLSINSPNPYSVLMILASTYVIPPPKKKRNQNYINDIFAQLNERFKGNKLIQNSDK